VEHLLSLGVDEALALRKLEVSLDRQSVKRGPGRRPKEPKGEGGAGRACGGGRGLLVRVRACAHARVCARA
jgi:hypothetical protein